MPLDIVIRCPKCNEDIGEKEAEFKPADKEHEFIVTCKLCNHCWTCHHRDFKERGTPIPKVGRNPFIPIHIPGVD